jgi:hypothetical protein
VALRLSTADAIDRWELSGLIHSTGSDDEKLKQGGTKRSIEAILSGEH